MYPRNAMANLHLLGQPNTLLAPGGGEVRRGAGTPTAGAGGALAGAWGRGQSSNETWLELQSYQRLR